LRFKGHFYCQKYKERSVLNIKLLSIDQSTLKTGIAIFEDNQFQKYDLIDLHKQKDSVQRFKNMCFEICVWIKETQPDIVVFEDVSLQTNVATLRLLAQLQGVIIGCCQLYEIPYKIYKPSEWRKLLDFQQGRGVERKFLKQQSKNYVKKYYDLEVNDDIADAVCIGTAYIKQNKN
jgi:Holliday junction resolvasome, endonuclease subunit